MDLTPLLLCLMDLAVGLFVKCVNSQKRRGRFLGVICLEVDILKFWLMVH